MSDKLKPIIKVVKRSKRFIGLRLCAACQQDRDVILVIGTEYSDKQQNHTAIALCTSCRRKLTHPLLDHLEEA